MSDSAKSKDEIQGEGNYSAAQEYDEGVREFVKRGKVKPAAENAAPESAEQERELSEAEEEGRSHARSSSGGSQ